jgi:DNA mismatch endonuclease (patch repair protein)
LRCKADVAFTKEKLAIFVDGCFWHRCPQHGSVPKANSHYWGPKLDANVARDRRNDEALQRAGWSVLRMWEHLATPQMADTVIRMLNALRFDSYDDVCPAGRGPNPPKHVNQYRGP